MIRIPRPSRQTVSRFAVTAAWFFIVVSLAHLVWVIGVGGDGTTKLYHTAVGGYSYDGWGLTYTNTPGLLLAIGQALAVTAAAVATVLPWGRTWRYRRLGHVVLCGWAALWALNLLWLASIDHQLDSIAQAALLSLLFGCTAYRATMGWSPGRSELRVSSSPRRKRLPVSFRAMMTASRGMTAAGLHRLGDFAHKQARRLAPGKTPGVFSGAGEDDDAEPLRAA
jgi:hypothetical protein